MFSRLCVMLQYLLPHHLLSRCIGYLANIKHQRFKNFCIRLFIKQFKVNLDEAQSANLDDYTSFNEFFTRALKPEARPLPKSAKVIASPVDGGISQIGKIQSGRIFQAKNHHYSLYELLGGETNHAPELKDGQFATIYLSPTDYHRVHMPLDGKLIGMTHVPGRLFSVNAATTLHVPRLFARNERAVMFFESDAGPFVLIMVGAMLVASIVTCFQGIITPPSDQCIRHTSYEDDPHIFKRGDELGQFQFGSTVILLFGQDTIKWESSLIAGTAIKLGQPLANRL